MKRTSWSQRRWDRRSRFLCAVIAALWGGFVVSGLKSSCVWPPEPQTCRQLRLFTQLSLKLVSLLVITSNSISRTVNWSGKWSAFCQRLMGKENLQICLFYPLFFLVPSSLLSLLSTPDALIFVFLSFIHLAQTAVSNWSRDIPGMPGHLCFVWESVHTPSTPRVEEEQRCSDYWEREGERGWEGEKKIDTSEMKERNKGEKKTGLVLIESQWRYKLDWKLCLIR